MAIKMEMSRRQFLAGASAAVVSVALAGAVTLPDNQKYFKVIPTEDVSDIFIGDIVAEIDGKFFSGSQLTMRKLNASPDVRFVGVYAGDGVIITDG